MKKPPLTALARTFVEQNKLSPLVYGAAHGRGGKGGIYRLANGMTFDLTAAEIGSIGEPRWAFADAA